MKRHWPVSSSAIFLIPGTSSFSRDIPIVFVKEIYAVASLVGILVFYLILSVGADLYVATIVGLVVATSLRLVAMKLKWNLPKVKGNT